MSVINSNSLQDCRKDFEPGMEMVSLSEDPATKTVTGSVPLASPRFTRNGGMRGASSVRPLAPGVALPCKGGVAMSPRPKEWQSFRSTATRPPQGTVTLRVAQPGYVEGWSTASAASLDEARR